MNTGFRSQCIPNYRILDEDQIKTIHQATLLLLESTCVCIVICRCIRTQALQPVLLVPAAVLNERIIFFEVFYRWKYMHSKE